MERGKHGGQCTVAAARCAGHLTSFKAVFGIGSAPIRRTTTGGSNPFVVGGGNRTEGIAVLGKKRNPGPIP